MASRPWSRAAKMYKPKTKKSAHAAKRKRVVPIERWDIRLGDRVEVVQGKDVGAQGIVRAVIRSRNLLIAEGCRMHKRFIPDSEESKGGLFSSEAPIPYSELQLVDPDDGLPTTVYYEKDDSGKNQRFSVRTNAPIPKPPFKRKDWSLRSEYEEGVMDTRADAVARVSHEVVPLTFEEDVLRSIVENGAKPAKGSD